MSRYRLSPHFTIEEFDCRDGRPVPSGAIPALKELCVNILEPMRSKYGPCKVLSGYRHVAYNRSIGGARFSQHIYDDTPFSVAVDVRFLNGSTAQWVRSVKWRFTTKLRWRRNNRGGIGEYKSQGFIHIDSGPRRDWTG